MSDVCQTPVRALQCWTLNVTNPRADLRFRDGCGGNRNGRLRKSARFISQGQAAGGIDAIVDVLAKDAMSPLTASSFQISFRHVSHR